jgi:small-conductance mechanosensitive channel
MNLDIVHDFFLQFGINSTISNYIVIALICLGGIGIFGTTKVLLLRLLHRQHNKHQSRSFELLFELLHVFSWPLYLIISLNFALRILPNLPSQIQDIVEFAALCVTILYTILLFQKLIRFIFNQLYKNKLVGAEGNEDQTIFKFIEFIAGILIWIIGIIFILQNRNIRVDALVGGLGVAGIGFAFALQNILADLFASVSIYTDKPFIIGDHIQIGEEVGEVTKIGLKTTRIRTIKGDELIISNRDISNSRIKNLARITKRKVFMEIILDKKYPKSKVEQVPKYLQTIVTNIPKTSFYSASLREIREDNFVFSLEYDVKRVGYKDFLSIQNTINFDILETFKAGRVDFKVL